MGFQISKVDIENIVNANQGCVEKVLLFVKRQLEEFMKSQQNNSNSNSNIQQDAYQNQM
jgi:hypothetical protein